MTIRLVSPILAASLVAVPVLAAADQQGQGAPRSAPVAVESSRQAPKPGQSGYAGQLEEIERATPQGFSVSLVLGDMSGAAPPSDTVPAAARKALLDMKDFLPYKSYRLLDVHWTLCCGRAPVTSRLRGPDGREYELSLTTSVEMRPVTSRSGVDSKAKLAIRFVLSDPRDRDADEAHRREEQLQRNVLVSELQRQRSDTARQLQDARRKAQGRSEVGAGGAPDEDPNVRNLRTRLSDLDIRLAEARQQAQSQGRRADSPKVSVHRVIMDASFRMEVGETVVVGTSRVQGGEKALIALLTAVPQKGTTTGTR